MQQTSTFPKDGEIINQKRTDSLNCTIPGKIETDPNINEQVNDPFMDQQLLSSNTEVDDSKAIEII